MAIFTITASLNGGDAVTSNNNLIFKIYDGSDDSLIDTTGSHITDSDVTVTGDTVVITNVISTATSFKISAVDEAGNEGILSDALASGYLIDLAEADAIVVPMTFGSDFDLTLVFTELTTATTGKYLWSNGLSSATNGHLGQVNTTTAPRYDYSVKDSGTLYRGGNSTVDANDGNEHSTRSWFKTTGFFSKDFDGVVNDELKALTTFDFSAATSELIIGAFDNLGGLGTAMKVESFILNGETFNCNEGSGNTTTGSLGTVATFTGNPTWEAK